MNLKMNLSLSITIFLAIAGVALAACSGEVKKTVESDIKPGVHKNGRIVLFVYQPSSYYITNVALTGDFNGWDPIGTQLSNIGGIWKITLELDYGVYQYKYILNNKTYAVDPHGESSAPDGLGGKNSVIEVKK